jgi:glycosyltransferase involved in cell wall biosynthesis
MAAPLISVIIPCHNYGSYISEAIDSIRSQTYSNWELIVIDDGSSDDTRSIVEKYCNLDSRINYQYQDKQGVSMARNAGFARAAGEYIQLLDADDLLAELKFEVQLALFAKYPLVALVYGDAYAFNHQTGASTREFTKFTLRNPPLSGCGTPMAMHMVYDNIFLISSPLFKKSLLEKLIGFNWSIAAFEDWEFWYRAILIGEEFIYDSSPGTEFFVRAHGNNTTLNRHKMWKSKLEARSAIMSTLTNMIKGKGENPAQLDLKSILSRHEAIRYEESARYNMLYGSVGKGILDTVWHSLKGEKPLRIWYDSAYWLKERLLRRS